MGLAKPGESSRLTSTGPGLACEEPAGPDFGPVSNRTDPQLRPKPGPLAAYPDPLLTLGNHPEVPDEMLMVMIWWVSNVNDIVLSPKQQQNLYTDLWHWEELNEFIHKNGGQKEAYLLTMICQCTTDQDKLDKEYIGIYTHGQMIIEPKWGHMSYNCHLSNTVKLKHGQNQTMFLIAITRATRKEFAEHVIRPANIIPASHVNARCAQLLIIILRLWKSLMRVEDRR